MKITVLVDNNTFVDKYLRAEPALSIFIQDKGINLLFDVGYSDMFIQNAHKLGINLLKLDYIVLSHGHLDHTWGLSELVKYYCEAAYMKEKCKTPTLVTHPYTIFSKTRKHFGEVGCMFSEEKLKMNFNVNLSKSPVWLNDKIVYLGEIKRQLEFEENESNDKIISKTIDLKEQYLDDSAIACKTNEGLVIITGCSHSGICNIVEQAKSVCKENRVVDIIGGFHLIKPPREKLINTLDYINSLNLQALHACHCTDLSSKIALSNIAPLKEVGSGLMLEYK